MSDKKRIFGRMGIAAGIAAGLAILLVASCDPLASISLNDRLNKFLADVGTNSADTYLNFSSTQTADYNAIKGQDWGTTFPAGIYTLSSINSGNESAVTATISGPSGFLGPKSITFKMTKETTLLASIYYIEELNLNNGELSIE